MKFARIKSKVLYAALQSNEFGMLKMYLRDFNREGEYFMSTWNSYCNEWYLRSSLCDYFFNEPESKKLWDLAEKTIGHRHIDLTVIRVVEV